MPIYHNLEYVSLHSCLIPCINVQVQFKKVLKKYMCRNQNKDVESPIAFIKYVWLKKLKSNVLDNKGCHFIGQAQIEPRCQSQTAKYDKSRSFKIHKISEKN